MQKEVSYDGSNCNPRRREAAAGAGQRDRVAAGAAAAGGCRAPKPTGKPLEIALDRIERNPQPDADRVRRGAAGELAQSIAATGVVQPVVVRELAGGRYQLIMGERRWRASQMAGKATIPAIVRQVSDEQAMEMTIVENLQRAGPEPDGAGAGVRAAEPRVQADPGADGDADRKRPRKRW